MKIVIKNRLLLSDIPGEIEHILMQRLKFPNPKWVENERMGRWNKGIREFLKFYEKTGTGKMIIPRGYIRQLILLCRHYEIPHRIEDKRRLLPEAG